MGGPLHCLLTLLVVVDTDDRRSTASIWLGGNDANHLLLPSMDQ